MSKFIKYYDHSVLFGFQKILPAGGGNYLAFGAVPFRSSYLPGLGLVTKFDASGDIVFSKKHTLNGDQYSFYDAVLAPNGDSVLCGITGTPSNGKKLVMRVDSNGDLVWAKTYSTSEIAFEECPKIVSLGSNQYIAMWSGIGVIYLVAIDGSGAVLSSGTIEASALGGTSLRGTSITVDGNQCVIMAHFTDDTVTRQYVIINFDHAFTTISAVSFTDPYVDGAHAVYRTGAGVFLVAAAYKPTWAFGIQHTALLEINLNTNTAIGKKIDATTWNLDPPGQKILFVNNNYYILQYHPHTHSVIKLNANLDVLWVKYFVLPWGGGPTDMDWISSPTNEFVFAGTNMPNVNDWQGLFARTDVELSSCMTQLLPQPVTSPLSFVLTSFGLTAAIYAYTLVDITSAFTTTMDVPTVITDCLCNQLNYDSHALFQSPHVYLQSSGSDGSDGSVIGYHLRWAFRKLLGQQHLPKGNLADSAGQYPTTIGFNRSDDFVRVYKTPYLNRYQVLMSFSAAPNALVESGATREWWYNSLVTAGVPGATTDIFVRFVDVAQYDALRVTYNPASNSIGLIAQYTGILEVGAKNKPSFSFRPNIFTTAGPILVQYEAISLPDVTDTTSRFIAVRGTHTSILGMGDVVAEDVEYWRFQYSGGYPKEIMFETCQDYIAGAYNDCTWTKVGDFCLDDGIADGDTNVFKQLQDTPNWQIDGQWPKYNDASNLGEFKVKLQNYQDRWNNDGLKTAVVDYLTLSQTDLRAIGSLAETGVATTTNPPSAGVLEVSYLDMLNLVSGDYHVARMLGMGHIHGRQVAHPSDRYVYLMEYVTEAELSEGSGPGFVRHYYMTPPVSIGDAKRPPVPVLENPPTYGLEMDVMTGTPNMLTDPNGYAPYGNMRFVNLHRQKHRYELPFENFFASTNPFNLYAESLPVAYGVEYRDDLASVGNYVKPELLHEASKTDPSGMPETTLIFETGKNPVFTHVEHNEGIHHYALYSINWFSRPSLPSNEASTDATLFPKLNSLLPPLNFAVQLIQPEAPRLFTTQDEQARLASILPAQDKTLVRATFDWNHIHNVAYQVADKVEFFHKEHSPLIVRGKIKSGYGAITIDANTHIATVQTMRYVIASSSPAVTVQPNILPTDVGRFIGGTFVANGKPFVIANVISQGLGDDPIFELEQLRDTQTIDPNNNQVYSTLETYDSPEEGEVFFVVENLNSASSWDSQLVKEVDIVPFLPLHTETVTYDDGTTQVKTFGGLYATATITHIPDPNPNSAPGTITGYYFITYTSGIHLPAIADPDTEFYLGSVRVPIGTTSEKKVLKVIFINDSGPGLQLVAYDPDHLTDPIIPNLAGAYPGIPVNFHPSYRVYFYADTVGGNNFEEATIMPAFNAGSKETYMSARSKDSSLAGYVSAMAPASVVLARELRAPVAPGMPMGGMFATRPNFYGKATYTFDVEVEHPFSLIFYRANERKILDTLYKPETVAAIYAQLDGMGEYDARFDANRWSDLVHVNTDGDDLFIEHVLNGFRFPIPDNDGYVIPNPNPLVIEKPFVGGTVPPGSTALVGTTGSTMRDIVRDAINGAFLPLSELPLVFDQLTQTTIETSGRKPKIRNANGDRLVFGTDPDYDPWPMSVRYERDGAGVLLLGGDPGYGNVLNTKLVRFSDYTLDGASKNIYFYFAVELSNTLQVSGRSPIAGPVYLMNAAAPEAPAIRKVTASLQDPFANTKFGVSLSVSGYLPSEGVVKYKLFRTFDATDALSVRTMQAVKEVSLGEAIVDDFSDLGYVPFTEPLYYRVVAFREIVNEQGDLELIPSKPSNLALTNVVDNTHPPQPVLQWSSSPLTPTHPLQYHDVKLSWNTDVYKGTYHLYKMDARGTWVKILTTQNGTAEIEVLLSATSFGSGTLLKEDPDGDTLYHLFRVQAVNSSGLVSIGQKTITV